METAREQFAVGGMSCSFCAESIRKAYDRTDGVEDADVSLATKRSACGTTTTG